MGPLDSKRRESCLRERESRSLRVSLFLIQSQPVECETESEGLLGDRPSLHMHAREITMTISGSQT